MDRNQGSVRDIEGFFESFELGTRAASTATDCGCGGSKARPSGARRRLVEGSALVEMGFEVDDMPHYTDPRTPWPRPRVYPTPTPSPGRSVWLTRSEWGADPRLPRLGNMVAPRDRTEVFIHHTVTPDRDSTPNEWETLDEVKATMVSLQRLRPDLGLDVPYNVVAFCMASGDLVLCEGRGIERSGAHTVGHNTSAIAVSFAGNFETAAPGALERQLTLLAAWLRNLRTSLGFVRLGSARPSGREVWGHRDVKATACPGAELFGRLAQVRFL